MKFAAAAWCAVALACCSSTTSSGPVEGKARLTARPQAVITQSPPGRFTLVIDVGRNAVLFVPSTVGSAPIPLVVMLHGAGGTVSAIEQIYDLGEAYGFAVLAPKSLGATWNFVIGGLGDDVPRIDKALRLAFQRLKTDPAKIALAGFSDGASYGLTLGLANGDLFTHLIAFSPGFSNELGRNGKPAIFITHGRGDTVLPFENTANTIVPFLRGLGYDVRFDEFAGGHHIDRVESELAAEWFLE